jgi:oligopeptide transport system ATP-binding protein
MPVPSSDASRQQPREDAILRVEELRTHFPRRDGAVIKAVDGVTLRLDRRRALGLVGESGCGKSTLARTILRLIPATSGRVFFNGHDVLASSPGQMRDLRREMQIVFQDPIGSLNPRMTVESIVGEALTVHALAKNKAERRRRVTGLFTRVGLSADDLPRYPHEFSGGQRQRIGIARALALEPRMIICDEPVSALDVSIQSQILNLLVDLQAEFGLSYLFIAHDLAVVRHFCDEIAVMYLGRIVEQTSAAELFRNPLHPYTQALLAAVPVADPHVGRAPAALAGEPPNPADPPAGCAFHPRCPVAIERCQREAPTLGACGTSTAGHVVACHRASESKRSQR